MCNCCCSSVRNCNGCWSEYSWNTDFTWWRRQTRKGIPGKYIL